MFIAFVGLNALLALAPFTEAFAGSTPRPLPISAHMTTRRLEADADHDITVDGPELAAHAIRPGLVDELQMIVCPVIVGGGKRFFPAGVRLDLELVEERRFGKGVVLLRYAVRG